MEEIYRSISRAVALSPAGVAEQTIRRLLPEGEADSVLRTLRRDDRVRILRVAAALPVGAPRVWHAWDSISDDELDAASVLRAAHERQRRDVPRMHSVAFPERALVATFTSLPEPPTFRPHCAAHDLVCGDVITEAVLGGGEVIPEALLDHSVAPVADMQIDGETVEVIGTSYTVLRMIEHAASAHALRQPYRWIG